MMIKKPPNPSPTMTPLLKKWKKRLFEGKKRKINVFLDMDGVLVNFDDAVRGQIIDNYGKNAAKIHPDNLSRRETLQKFQKLKLSVTQVGDLYDSVNEKHKFGLKYDQNDQFLRDYFYALLINNQKLWLNMKKLQNSDIVVKNAFHYADNVYVLSAPVDKESEKAKKEWIEAHFPAIKRQNVFLALDKGAKLFDLMNRGTVDPDDLNILIDDRPRFIQSFTAASGKGVQYDHKDTKSAIDQLKALINN